MNFIEIDRSILETIGFKNIFIEVKDTNGKLKIDEAGNPKLQDAHNDFQNATRSLRRNRSFVEGKSFDDPNAHFVIKRLKIPATKWGSVRFRHSVWIRQDMLDKWINYAKISRNFNRKTRNGLVYFIHDEGDFKRFKIGYTTNLSVRLSSIQIGNPDPLVVYKTIENSTKYTETKLHHLFAQYQIRGEWFAIDSVMIDQIYDTM